LTSDQGNPAGKSDDGARRRLDLGGMADADDLNDAENWAGGFYELELVLGVSDDARIRQAMWALWAAAGVEGEPAVEGHARGTVTLPSGARVVCGAFVARYDESDSVELYLPLGALARADRRIGGYPFGGAGASLRWRAPLDRWLADVAATVHAQVPFRRALIGFEIDVDRDITAERRYIAVLDENLLYRPATA
jgi:hypothetical protein